MYDKLTANLHYKIMILAQVTCWFIGIYALTMAMFLIVFSYVKIDNTSWILDSIIYAPKIYLLVLGIVYPLVVTKLYVSRGLTRKQFFWAFTGAISIISLFLLIPILASIIYYDNISLLSAITHYLHMPLFFLIGWTSVVGFQLRKWHMAILGILGAAVVFHAITTLVPPHNSECKSLSDSTISSYRIRQAILLFSYTVVYS